LSDDVGDFRCRKCKKSTVDDKESSSSSCDSWSDKSDTDTDDDSEKEKQENPKHYVKGNSQLVVLVSYVVA